MYEKMLEAGKITAEVLNKLHSFIQPGISTQEINDFCHEYILSQKATAACIGYQEFPSAVCTSVNHVVCHGIPSSKEILKEGDIISVDLVVEKNGYHGDSCFTYAVGNISIKNQHIIDSAYETMWHTISHIKAGISTGDLGYLMESYALSKNYFTVRDFCGHGIGKSMHLPPSIPFYGTKNTGQKLLAGQYITIEPMLTIGKTKTQVLSDGWTAIVTNGENTAQFEHTILVLETGYEVMTYNIHDEKIGKLRKKV